MESEEILRLIELYKYKIIELEVNKDIAEAEMMSFENKIDKLTSMYNGDMELSLLLDEKDRLYNKLINNLKEEREMIQQMKRIPGKRLPFNAKDN